MTENKTVIIDGRTVYVLRHNADGFWVRDPYTGEEWFVYDFAKIARETGFTLDDVKMYGVSWCRRNAKRGGHMAWGEGDLIMHPRKDKD